MKINIQSKIETTSIPVGQLNRIAKRSFDIVVSLSILLLISPLLCGLALLILIFDGRQVLFRQKRIGKDHNDFMIWKFRSMKNKPTETSRTYNWDGKVPDDFIFKTSYNPSITRLGRFIRKYSLDELPQFFNVLFGHMSIVGPRPEVPEITQYYDSNQAQRLLVKPGITGLAQVNGRSKLSHGEKIEYDLYYVRNNNFLMDIQIFLKTIRQTLLGRGAY